MVLWVLGVVLTYSALRDLAVMLGFPDSRDLFPLVIELLRRPARCHQDERRWQWAGRRRPGGVPIG